MQRVLADATSEAARRGHTWIGTEHILLALASEKRGVAAQVLAKLGVREAVREELQSLLDDPRYATASSNVVVNHEGNLFGYMVIGDDGEPLVVDEHGVPKEPAEPT